MAKKKKEGGRLMFIPFGFLLGLGFGALSGDYVSGILIGVGAVFFVRPKVWVWGEKK